MYLVLGWGTWSWGCTWSGGGVPGLVGVYLVPGGVPGLVGVYLVWWGCTWSQGVYLVPGGVPGPRGCTWSQGGVPGPGGSTWAGTPPGPGTPPPPVDWSGTPPVDRQRPVNLLPCPKLHLRAVIRNGIYAKIQVRNQVD